MLLKDGIYHTGKAGECFLVRGNKIRVSSNLGLPKATSSQESASLKDKSWLESGWLEMGGICTATSMSSSSFSSKLERGNFYPKQEDTVDSSRTLWSQEDSWGKILRADWEVSMHLLGGKKSLPDNLPHGWNHSRKKTMSFGFSFFPLNCGL